MKNYDVVEDLNDTGKDAADHSTFFIIKEIMSIMLEF